MMTLQKNPNKRRKLEGNALLNKERAALPIYTGKDRILAELKQNVNRQPLIVVGDTGSGKTTRMISSL
jgi:HrpA-like RNA helicase